jgi:hypothetical protein
MGLPITVREILPTILIITAIVISWLVAGAAWWTCRGGHRDRARKLGHLAWLTSIVALFVPMAAEKIAAAFPPDGLTAPQAGLMAELSKGIVQGRWVYDSIYTVLFVIVTGSAGVIGIWIVVRCRRGAR